MGIWFKMDIQEASQMFWEMFHGFPFQILRNQHKVCFAELAPFSEDFSLTATIAHFK